MALTKEKQDLLARLNQEAQQTFEAERIKALERGKPAPKPPEPLKPEDVDFPRYLFKKGTGKDLGNGLFTAESTLVKSDEALAALGPDWVNSPAEAGKAKHKDTLSGLAQAEPVESTESAEKYSKKVK